MKHCKTQLSAQQLLLAGLLLVNIQISAAGELKDFASAALQNDQQLKVADAQRRGRLENKDLLESSLKPLVSASTAIQQTTITDARANSTTIVSSGSGGGGTVISGGNQSYRSTYYGASVQQPLFDWEAIQGFKRGKVESSLADLAYTSAIQSLFYRVSDAYFSVLSAQSTLETDRNLVLSNEREVRRQDKSLQSGLGTTTDLLTAQAALNAAKSQLIVDQLNSDAAESALAIITGLHKKVTQRLSDDLPLLPPNPSNLSYWQDLALNANPDLAAAIKNVESAELQRKAAYGGYLPRLAGVGAYSANKTNTENGNDSSSYYYGLNISLPLYNGGSTSAKYRQAEAARDAAAAQLNLIKTQLTSNVVLHFNSVYAGITGVKTAIQSVQANEANVVAFEASAKAGARSVTDSVIARSNLAVSQKVLTEATLRYLRNLILLKQDAGQLQLNQISELDGYLIDAPRY